MKKIFYSILVISFLFSSPLLAKEDKSAEKKEVVPSPKEVSTAMADVWCKKMEECTKSSTMSVQECRKEMFKNFKTGFDNIPKDQKIEVSRQSMDQCVSNIEKGTCGGLKTAQSLPGCEFISQLGQTN